MAKNTNNSKKAIAAAKKFESDLPEVAKRHHIRVSNPYGYYPEDVDKLIVTLENDISHLEKENHQLSKEVEQYSSQLKAVQTELTQLKMQVSLMEIPDTSATEDFVMLSRISTITGKHEELPQQEVDTVPQANIRTVTTKTTEQPATYSNLVKPKLKL